jgi:hypothetical protein
MWVGQKEVGHSSVGHSVGEPSIDDRNVSPGNKVRYIAVVNYTHLLMMKTVIKRRKTASSLFPFVKECFSIFCQSDFGFLIKEIL